MTVSQHITQFQSYVSVESEPRLRLEFGERLPGVRYVQNISKKSQFRKSIHNDPCK